MIRFARTVAAFPIVLLVAVAAMSPAGATTYGKISSAHDNFVTVDNRTAHATRAESQTDVALERGTRIDNQNIAYAHASCTDCRTVAVAVQVIVAYGPYSYAAPENAAVAINENCVRCFTAAYARQYMITPTQEADIQPTTWHQLADLDREIARVTATPLDGPTLFSRLDTLVAQFETAIQHDLDSQAGGVARDVRDAHSQQG